MLELKSMKMWEISNDMCCRNTVVDTSQNEALLNKVSIYCLEIGDSLKQTNWST